MAHSNRFTDLAPCLLIPCICVRVVWRRENALRVFHGSVYFVSVTIIIILIILNMGYLTVRLGILITNYLFNEGNCLQIRHCQTLKESILGKTFYILLFMQKKFPVITYIINVYKKIMLGYNLFFS